MGFFGFGKKDRVIDLAASYRKQQEKDALESGDSKDTSSENSPSSSGSAFGFLGGLASAGPSSGSSTESKDVDLSSSGVEDKRKKLAKRLIDMTSRIEDLNNQIYHLQQRVEVLERKSGVNTY